jgi:putative DNA primase/helicase
LLKTIISGDAIRAEYKFENEFEFEPVATILIGMNNTVTFADTSDGFARRFKVIPFNHKFIEGKNRNNNMKNILCTSENLKYICSKAMFYFNQVLKEDKFSTPQEVESETKSYLLENRIVEQFLIDVPVGKSETAEVYAEFKSWCKENDYTVLSRNYLGKELLRLGFEKRRNTTGKRTYYYISPNYKEEDDISARIEQANQVDIKDTVFDIGINLDELGL